MPMPKKERGARTECTYCRRSLPTEEMVKQNGSPTNKCRDCVRFLSQCYRVEMRQASPDTSGMYHAAAWALGVQRWSDTDRDIESAP